MSMDWRDGLEGIDGLTLRRDESMAPFTTYRIGGPARAFLEVETSEALGDALNHLAQQGVPYCVIGNGSNVLFSDRGFEGAVIHLGAGFQEYGLSRDFFGPGEHRLEAGGAVTINRLLRFANKNRTSGIEALGGIPGTVGGAVRMNAGTALGEVKDSLESAAIVRPNLPETWLPVDELVMSYRTSQLPEGGIVTAARFRVGEDQPETRERLQSVLAYRKQTQPLQYPSCGSVFANPSGDHAGRLIEASGLKGTTIGGAQISPMHANWIINLGDAQASDVQGLIDRCIETVRDQHGVTLRHEVKFMGDWE